MERLRQNQSIVFDTMSAQKLHLSDKIVIETFSDSNVIMNQTNNTYHEIKLNIDELEKEFKESQLN